MNHTSNDTYANGLSLPPLALYIHIPWCVRKCPYCDFNSYEQEQTLPVDAYVDALKRDLQSDQHLAQGRPISSIFFGGGTPSLFPSTAIFDILNGVRNLYDLTDDAEITIEVNPGTSEYSRFDVLRESGVNRLSFGAQSFDDLQLAQLGRIHTSDDIYSAIEKARQANFDNFNIDLMHSLPGQSPASALRDIEYALSLNPTHLSWYQLTIEPNTAFYSAPPTLPDDDEQNDIYRSGQAFLEQHQFEQYEVSAYAKAGKASVHNINYWQFGDYLAAGAGAHGKITLPSDNTILRFNKTRTPKDYLSKTDYFNASSKMVPESDRPLEFMMNALRLLNGVDRNLFSERTGLPITQIETAIQQLQNKGWLSSNNERIQTTKTGHYFLNDILSEFLADF